MSIKRLKYGKIMVKRTGEDRWRRTV